MLLRLRWLSPLQEQEPDFGFLAPVRAQCALRLRRSILGESFGGKFEVSVQAVVTTVVTDEDRREHSCRKDVEPAFLQASRK